MYELRNGTSRLVRALMVAKYDPTALQMIAKVTNYLPDQLEQDIQALSDFVDMANDKDNESEE